MLLGGALLSCAGEGEGSRASQTGGAPSGCDTARACVTEASAVLRDDGFIGLEFAGVGAEAHVQWASLELLDGAGQALESYPRLDALRVAPRFPRTADYGQLRFDGAGRFAGFWVIGDAPSPARVRLWIEDTDGAADTPLELEVVQGASPRPVALGEDCDYDGVLYVCPGGSSCDLRDGTDRAICQKPVTECAAGIEMLALDESGADGNVEASPDETLGSCSQQRGNLGAEQAFRYTAPNSGTYRFRAEGDAASLWVRRHCSMPGPGVSELGCVWFTEMYPVAESFAELDVSLEAGEPVFVFVEAAWFGGGPYRLTVTPLG